MSNDSNLKNPIWWPNGFEKVPGIDGELGTDDDKVKFYPLGTRKVEIPDDVNEWPDGDALIGNFVYKDGKLVNFIDTAALMINSSGATTMPYDVIDTEFRSIFEGTLSITGPSQMNIRYQTDIVKFISNILLEYKVTQNDGYKILLDEADPYLIDLKLSSGLMSKSQEILTRISKVLPDSYDLTLDAGLPYDFEEIEYIESSGTQYIDTGFQSTANTTIELDMQQVAWGNILNYMMWAVGGAYCPYPFIFGFVEKKDNKNQGFYALGSESGGYITSDIINDTLKENKGTLSNTRENFIWNNITIPASDSSKIPPQETNNNMLLFGAINSKNTLIINKGMRSWGYKMYLEGELKQHLIPAIDEHGDACMYDLINNVAKYNIGSGSFDYPGKEQVASTYSLRDPYIYAKLTEHGVRRLYHVPKGCTLTKEKYAKQNGFKLLVETPKPEEGYWNPEWRETDTELILDWIEAEAPIGEEIV